MKREVELTAEELSSGCQAYDTSQYWEIKSWQKGAPKDIKKALREVSCKWWVAILHNRCEKEDGKPVTPHYHILIDRGGTCTRNSTIKYRDAVDGTYLAIKGSKEATLRYFLHSEDNEKIKYNISELIFDTALVSEGEIRTLLKEKDPEINDKMDSELEELIINENITEYNDLICILRKRNLMPLLKRVRRASHSHIRDLLQSRLFGGYEKQKKVVVKEKEITKEMEELYSIIDEQDKEITRLENELRKRNIEIPTEEKVILSDELEKKVKRLEIKYKIDINRKNIKNNDDIADIVYDIERHGHESEKQIRKNIREVLTEIGLEEKAKEFEEDDIMSVFREEQS